MSGLQQVFVQAQAKIRQPLYVCIIFIISPRGRTKVLPESAGVVFVPHGNGSPPKAFFFYILLFSWNRLARNFYNLPILAAGMHRGGCCFNGC
jgi:hypothetical protein